MLNPDGVYLGHYRCSLMGFDLNCHWLHLSLCAHPTLYGVKQLIIRMCQAPELQLLQPESSPPSPQLEKSPVQQ